MNTVFIAAEAAFLFILTMPRVGNYFFQANIYFHGNGNGCKLMC
jgi:hypothetical protein